MGTDIHGFLESRYRPDRPWFRELSIERTCNYRVFAALADVRNGYGTAGVPTHKAIEPIAPARGLPEDHTNGYGKDAEGEFGEHSFSWLTLNELATWHGWDQELHEQGWIDRDQYADWLKNPDQPPANGWSGGVSGTAVIHANHHAQVFPDGWTHIEVRWTRSLREACGLFLAWLNYAQVKVGEHEARIVFGFDS